jgi:murein DD-endopeptidase MepM/ murein hydrolase activator NlpD
LRTLLLLLASLTVVWANTIPTEAHNGCTTFIELPSTDASAKLEYDGKKIPIISHPGKQDTKIALIPVPYRSQTGDKPLLYSNNGKTEQFPFCVLKKDYPSETLTVAGSKVKPNEKQRTRISREYREAMAVYSRYTDTRYWNEPFALPMTSAITSRYGTARIYNGTLKSFHSGTDFRAKIGTPITAVNDGVVVIAQDRYYAGNSVVIDHGEGLYSCYYHLSRLDVKVGDRIAKHQSIGLSGMTGRVTGPHLHFAFMLHGVQVDPLQLIDTINSLFPSVASK